MLESAILSERIPVFIRAAEEQAVQTTGNARTSIKWCAALFAPQNVLFADWH
jgi:hypothetical protein